MRLALADELVRVGSATGAGMLALLGLCWRTVDLLHLGDPGAARALADLRTRADAVECRSVTYVVEVIEVMVLIRSGRLDAGEDAALACHRYGCEVGEVDADAYLGLHLFTIRWLQGRAAEVVDVIDDMAASPKLAPVAAVSFRAGLAAMAAYDGQLDRAAAVLDDLVADGLDALPQSSGWLTAMRLIGEAARILGREAIARDVHRLLLAHADHPVVASLGVVDHGSVEGALGSAALTFGALDAAVAHLERAVAADDRLANRPFAAIGRAHLANALWRRGGPGDGTRAAGLHQVASPPPRPWAWCSDRPLGSANEGRPACCTATAGTGRSASASTRSWWPIGWAWSTSPTSSPTPASRWPPWPWRVGARRW